MMRGLFCRVFGWGFVFTTLVACPAFSGQDKPDSQDASWAAYETAPALDADAVETRAFYITMRDGVRIAVDLHLPKGRETSETFPAIIHSTRYMRAVSLRWPKKKDALPGERVRRFLANGYAWLDVDSRGSGASFGYRPCPWSPDEIKDYGEIAEWIVNQPWSNGIVGGTGVSYDGTTAEMLAVNKHPAVKAVVPEFSLFDAYTDIGFPGGIHMREFTKKWGQGNALIDANAAKELAGGGLAGWIFQGVKPVDADTDGSLLAAAVKSHRYNCNVYDGAIQMTYKNDLWPCDPTLSLEAFSPMGYLDELNSADTAIYGYSGWFDGAYQNAAINRYLSLTRPDKKLVIGPWSHGGRWNCSPVAGVASNFDHVGELLRYFDHHLKGKDTGIESEAPIHYYTMVEEKWKTATDWPPTADPTTWYFTADNGLAGTAPQTGDAYDTYEVRYDTGTGTSARWDTLLGGSQVIYPDRRDEDEKLLTYTSAPLSVDTEVTGHGTVTLEVASTAHDGEFFVYLEDVTPEGTVRYVTEGELRALHRKISSEPPPYNQVGVYHSFRKADGELMEAGEVTELVIDLLPTSYLFEAGHRIRIAIAGADIDHFGAPLPHPPVWKVHRDAAHASRVELPVVDR